MSLEKNQIFGHQVTKKHTRKMKFKQTCLAIQKWDNWLHIREHQVWLATEKCGHGDLHWLVETAPDSLLCTKSYWLKCPLNQGIAKKGPEVHLYATTGFENTCNGQQGLGELHCNNWLWSLDYIGLNSSVWICCDLWVVCKLWSGRNVPLQVAKASGNWIVNQGLNGL